MYDNRIHVLKNALGLHTAVSGVQGGELKAKAEIHRRCCVSRHAELVSRLIVVHELAHLKEKEHNKAFSSCAAIWSRSPTSLSSTHRLWLTRLWLGSKSENDVSVIFSFFSA